MALKERNFGYSFLYAIRHTVGAEQSGKELNPWQWALTPPEHPAIALLPIFINHRGLRLPTEGFKSTSADGTSVVSKAENEGLCFFPH